MREFVANARDGGNIFRRNTKEQQAGGNHFDWAGNFSIKIPLTNCALIPKPGRNTALLQ
jgi:hypothetical protein